MHFKFRNFHYKTILHWIGYKGGHILQIFYKILKFVVGKKLLSYHFIRVILAIYY